MQIRTWIRIFVSSIVVIMIPIITINYIVNPYNIFQPNHHTQYNRLKEYIISERMTYFYEMQFIKPKTLMVGTSRIGYFKSNTLKPYSSSPIFNLSLSDSTVYEQRQYIEYAIKHLPIKTVVWSLDFFSFNPTKEAYPDFSEDRLNHRFYLNDYLISLYSYRTFERSLKTLKKNRLKAPFDDNVSEYHEQSHYMDVQGQNLSLDTVRKNANLTLNEYAEHKNFLNSQAFLSPHSINEKISDVAYIVELCKENNITCLIYTSPVYREHIDMIYSMGLGNTYEYWKRELSSITNYWDFNTYNSLTENIMNFRDSSHMVSDNGKYIFTKLFKAAQNQGPSDFGFYVTKENISTHLTQQRRLIHPFTFHKDFPASINSSE